MPVPSTNPRTRALTLPEVLATLTILTLLAAALLSAASESRRQSSLGDNLANLKQFATATGAYAADNDDRIWTFTWQPGIDYGYGGIATNPFQAAANQAWHILRTRSGRPDWFGSTPPNWIPHVLYNHLVLLDYLGSGMPQRFVAAPEDALRHLWQDDPFEGFETLTILQRPMPPSQINRRWPFSSSYELPPAFYAPDAATASGGTLSQNGSGCGHNCWVTPTNITFGRRLTEITFPSQKVMVHEQYQRHFGPRVPYFMHTEARVPLTLADGSAMVRRTSDANRGFDPAQPTSATVTRVPYEPAAWEPATLNGQQSELLFAHYRFTRSGLRGRDFGGPEVPWTP